MAFTPTEARIYAKLSDGHLCTISELFMCLEDELAKPQAIAFHISNMRKRLADAGEDIVWRDGGYYLARRVNMYEDGHRVHPPNGHA
jgi:hypothetical protein